LGYPLVNEKIELCGLWLKHRDSFQREPVYLGDKGMMMVGSWESGSVVVVQDIWTMLELWLKNRERLYVVPVFTGMNWEKKMVEAFKRLEKANDVQIRVESIEGEEMFQKRLKSVFGRLMQ